MIVIVIQFEIEKTKRELRIFALFTPNSQNEAKFSVSI